MPFISVVVPTMRVGGIDVLLDSLARQTWTDFELVLVDGIKSRRAAAVAKEARDRFLCVQHVGLEPSPFPHCAFCLYSNAGIAASSGAVILFAVDYTRFPPGLLARHAAFHKQDPTGRGGLMGPHRYVGLNPLPDFPRYDRGEVDRYEADVKEGRLDRFMLSIGSPTFGPSSAHLADGGVMVPPDADPKLRLPAGPITWDYFHAKNESVRRERVLEVDGYDQELDGAHLYQDSDFAERLSLKAGVKWALDPHAIVDIINPRHFFPFARRSRPHEENKAIWERKRAAGYPEPPASVLVALKAKERVTVEDDPSVGRVVEVAPRKKLRVAMVYGEFSSAIHEPFDIGGLYERVGLTGSEGSFFNLARTFSERGHEVAVFCRTQAEADHPSGFKALPIQMLGGFPRVQGVDAVLAWNEPDYLQFAPQGALRVCDQQLNDFGYSGSQWYAQAGAWLGANAVRNWADLVDIWVSPSRNHAANVMQKELPGRRTEVIPNSVDLGLIGKRRGPRVTERAVWCSSPDRGLHHVLSFWPEVRKRVPTAELRIFYRLRPWLDRMLGMEDEQGRRARYIENAIERLRPMGVTVLDVVPNVQMMRELGEAMVLAYPCDTVRYTEGFGCSVLDAAAAGCVPIISGADALPEVHGSAAIGIPGPPQEQRAAWVDAICSVMQKGYPIGSIPAMERHVQAHSREAIADRWEKLILSR